MTVVKFPYTACRRVHSRHPRISKNGTPEERAAAKAAATSTELITRSRASEPSEARMIEGIERRRRDRPRKSIIPKQNSEDAGPRGPTIVEFIQQLRAYIVQELASGKEIDQIFGDLEESYRRLEKALRKKPLKVTGRSAADAAT
jgi:hypothetical protein